jgi:hypothetical protein
MSDVFGVKMSKLFEAEASREDKVRGIVGGAAWALFVLSLAGLGVLVWNLFAAGISLAFVGNTPALWNRDLWMVGLWTVVGGAGITVVCAIIGRR